MQQVPTVSVALPTYNQPSLLVETLDSVLAQTFSDFEVVIVDDGSTDDTPLLLDRYLRERFDRIAGRIRVIRQPNQGIGPARNRAVAEGRGRYVALLDHDDLWMPEKLQVQVNFMKAHPECSIVVVPWSYSTNPTRPAFDVKSISDKNGIIARPAAALAASQAFIMSSAMMYDRQRAEGLAFETDRRTVEDIPFHLKLLARGPAGVAGDEILMVYRAHDANYSSNSINFYRGVPMMRAMNRTGLFGGKTVQGRQDISAYLAQLGRIAVVMQVRGGHRWRALAMYVREMRHQLRQGRLQFLLIAPLLLVCPQGLIRRVWSREVR